MDNNFSSQPDPFSAMSKYSGGPLLGPDGRPIQDDSAGFLLPHHRTFAAVWSAMNDTYYWKYDEAIKHSEENALAMRRDAFIEGVLQERYLQLAGLSWHLEPDDQKDGTQKAVADALDKIVRSTPRWAHFIHQLSEAIWYGRYGNQIKYGSRTIDGVGRMAVLDHRPVNGDKIHFNYDGSAQVMIQASEASELIRKGMVKDDDIIYGGRSPMLKLQDRRWRERFVIHKHICVDADFFEGEMAGGVHGVGLRSKIYWAYWLRDEMLGWALNHLKKIGVGGILVFYYESGNPESKNEAEKAAKTAGERYAIAMPRNSGGSKDTSGAELLSFNESGVASMTSIIQDYFERHIQRLVIGQELSSTAASTGLGSGVAAIQEDTKFRILKFDAAGMQDTITEEFVDVIRKWNFPRADFPIRFRFDIIDPRAESKLQAASMLFQMGGKVRVDEVMSAGGLTVPQEDDETLDQISLLKAQTDIQLQAAQVQMDMQMQAQQQQMQQQAQLQSQQMQEQAQMQAQMQGMEQAQQGQMPDQEQMAAQGQEQAPDQGQMQAQMPDQEQGAQPQDSASVYPQEASGQQVADETANLQPQDGGQESEIDAVLSEILGDTEDELEVRDEVEEEREEKGDKDAKIVLDDGTEIKLPDPGKEVNNAISIIEEPDTGIMEGGVQYASVHAPAGGITISGQDYEGGQFIPAKAIEKASPAEKAELESRLSGRQSAPDRGQPESDQPERERSQPSGRQAEDDGRQESRQQESQGGEQVSGLDVGDDVGVRVPSQDDPVLADHEFEDIQLSERWLKTVDDYKPMVMESIKRYGKLKPKEYYRERGKAYQKVREVNHTGQDVVNAQAFKIIDQYSGDRSKILEKKQSKKGVPQVVQRGAEYMAKKGLSSALNIQKTRRDVKNDLLKSSLRDVTAGSLGLDDQTVANAINSAPDPVRAKRKYDTRKHIYNVAIQAAGDAITHMVRTVIAKSPKYIDRLFTKNTNVSYSTEDQPLIFLIGEERPVVYFDENGAMQEASYEPVPADSKLEAIAIWLRDRIKAKVRRTRKFLEEPISEMELEQICTTMANKIAPMVLSAINTYIGTKGNSKAKSKGTSGGKADSNEPQAYQLNIAEFEEDLKKEAAAVEKNPSVKQVESGNYKKGHVNWHGIQITIENPAGTIRSGSGWSIQMKDHYGYIKKTEAVDGDHVDVFLCEDNLESEIIFVVKQLKPSGRFDEYKCIIGCTNKEDAKEVYLRNYSKGWTGYGGCDPMTLDQFKEWLAGQK